MQTDEVRFAARPALLAGLLLAVALAAPAFAEAEPEAEPEAAAEAAVDEDAKLQERAQAYWEARVTRQPTVLEFYPPPDKLPPDVKGTHAEGGSVGWSSFEIEAVKADGDEGLVQVRARMLLGSDFDARIPESMRHLLQPTIMERWIRVEGVWYKRPVEMGLSRMMRAQRETEAAEGETGSPAPPGASSEVAAEAD